MTAQPFIRTFETTTDQELDNLRSDLRFDVEKPAQQLREEFEAKAIKGYTPEAIEVFQHIDTSAYEMRDQLLMALMQADTSEKIILCHKQIVSWLYSQVHAVAASKYQY